MENFIDKMFQSDDPGNTFFVVKEIHCGNHFQLLISCLINFKEASDFRTFSQNAATIIGHTVFINGAIYYLTILCLMRCYYYLLMRFILITRFPFGQSNVANAYLGNSFNQFDIFECHYHS